MGPNDRMVSEHWTGRDVEGSGMVQFALISQSLTERI